VGLERKELGRFRVIVGVSCGAAGDDLGDLRR